jgi:glycosyltransferase involved in cell wall biosynthesis
LNIHFAYATFVRDGGEGITNNIVALRSALERRGVNVTHSGPSVELRSLNHKTVRVSKGLEAVPYFREALADTRADVLHFHLAVPSQAFLVRLASPFAAVPPQRRIGHLWNALAEAADLQAPGSRAESLWHGVLNGAHVTAFGLRSFGTVVVSSAHQERQLVRAGFHGKVVCIPNGVDIERFHPASPEERVQARAALGLPVQATLITYFGHLTPWKGVRHLAQAFGAVAAAHPQALLVIARTPYGSEEGAIRRSLERMGLTRRTLFLGKVDPAMLLHASDVVVAPNVAAVGTAVFPNVVLESLAAGLPLVTTDIVTHREVITHGVNALLVPPSQPGAIAEAVIGLLSNSGLQQQLALAARETAVSRFDWNAIAAKFGCIYDSMLAGEGARVRAL